MGLAPGPDILFVLTQSALYGARAGFATTCGLITGLFVHITAVSLGVAALFQSSETAFNVLKFAGAAYLLYLAWLSFRSGTSNASLQKAQFPGYGTLYRIGVIMNITYPKVTGLWLRVTACGTGHRAFQQFRQGAAVPEPCRRLRFHRAGGHAACLFPLIAPPILPPHTPTAFRKGRYPFRHKDPFHGGPPGNFPVPAKRREASSCCEDCLPP